MIRAIRVHLHLILGCVSLAACSSVPTTIDPAKQQVQGGRDLLVSIPQSEVIAAYEPSRAGGAGFGLIGALVDAGINQSRASSAETAVQPLRDSLLGYDFDRRAVDVTQAALAGIPWMQTSKTTFSREFSAERINGRLDESKTPQMVIVSYSYNLLPGYEKMGVDWRVSILPTVAPEGQQAEDRLDDKNVIYRHSFGCVQKLRDAPEEPKDRIAIWAQDHGARARATLDGCLAKVSPLLMRGLTLTAAEQEAMSQGESIKEGGQRGALVSRDATGVALAVNNAYWLYVLGDLP